LAIGLQGRWAEALPALDRAVLLSPRLQRARLNLGRALGELGRQAEARAQWQAVLGLDPQSADAEEARKKLGP
jgi:tetratricopeptide (TPR) repeat protein